MIFHIFIWKRTILRKDRMIYLVCYLSGWSVIMEGGEDLVVPPDLCVTVDGQVDALRGEEEDVDAVDGSHKLTVSSVKAAACVDMNIVKRDLNSCRDVRLIVCFIFKLCPVGIKPDDLLTLTG